MQNLTAQQHFLFLQTPVQRMFTEICLFRIALSLPLSLIIPAHCQGRKQQHELCRELNCY